MGLLQGLICLTVIVDFRFGRPGDWRAGIISPERPARWGLGRTAAANSLLGVVAATLAGSGGSIVHIVGGTAQKLRMRDSRS